MSGSKNVHTNPTLQPDYRHSHSLQELINERALQHPDKVALRFREHILTYHQLNNTANQFAAQLVHTGIRPGHVVGIAVDRSPEMLISLLAILKAGATYLPLDPEYPKARIEFMLEDAGAKLLITNAKYSGRFQSPAKEMLVETLVARGPQYDVLYQPVAACMDDVAYVLYTSGSTGKPKGVQILQSSFVNFLLSMQQKPGMRADDRVLALTTISFDISGLELFLPLITGAEIILADAAAARDANILMKIVRKEKVTVMQATPATWRMMLEVEWDEQLSLKALCGGEALPAKLAARLLEKCSSLWNMYGPTETTIWATIKEIKKDDAMITIGHAIDNLEAYVLDEQLQPVPDGKIGEIYIGGAGVAKGYLNRPALTAERFLPDPFAPHTDHKIYRTGDLGRIVSNGEIQCLGRVDTQVKIRGYRIELEEVEHVLGMQQGVREAVVLASNERLIAYVVSYTAIANAPALWRNGLKAVLPEYMLPSHFVVLPYFPLTANGKIDRNALITTGTEITNANKVYVAPATEMEKLVAGTWSHLLRIEKISIHDDFFELGGSSIIAMQIMSRLEKETGKRLPLASLFTANTVAKLAAQMNAGEQFISWDLLVPIKPTGNKPPVFVVSGLDMSVLLFKNMAGHIDKEQPLYGFQPRGLNGIDKPFETLEEMASAYIGALLKGNFGDVYALAGYSYGGVVAFEMARQLQAMGKQVHMLAMFDTYGDNSIYFESGALRWTKKIKRQFPKFRFIVGSFIKNPLLTLGYQFFVFRGRLKEAAVFFGLKKPVAPGNIEEMIDEKYETAYRNYKMQPSDASAIDLFRVDTRLYYLDDPVYLGWKPYALKGIHIHEVKGDHKTFFMPPNDKVLATALQRLLDERFGNPRQQ